MAFISESSKEIRLKIAYLGPKAGGKTENLKAIYTQMLDIEKSKIQSEEGVKIHKRFFDFLPVSLGVVGGYHVKLHLYALPLEAPFSSLKKLVLTDIDGWVFVADSHVLMLEENLTALNSAKNLICQEGLDPDKIPVVMQYNKRDLHKKDLLPLDILNQELNTASHQNIEAIARQQIGTFDTLDLITKKALSFVSFEAS